MGKLDIANINLNYVDALKQLDSLSNDLHFDRGQVS